MLHLLLGLMSSPHFPGLSVLAPVVARWSMERRRGALLSRALVVLRVLAVG